MIKNVIKNGIIIFLILFIIILFVLIYLSDKQNIYVQKHLNSIHSNKKILHNKYKPLINEEVKVKYENNIIIIEDFLNPEFYDFLKNQFNGKTYKPINTLLRKAAGYDFFTLHDSNEYFGFLELYYTNELIDVLSDVLKKPVQRTPLSDTNSCSLLIYSKKGDYINWHKDHSKYNGDRYVVLLTVINENSSSTNLSENEFHYMFNDNEYKIKMKPNTLTIFKGSEIMHKSTSIAENEKRILLSMTFCDICEEKKNLMYFVYEKLKGMILYK